MGRKEEPMIAYYENVKHFAWLVNGWIYHGKNEIDETQIRPKNIRLTGKSGTGKSARTRTRYRDISKELGKMKIMLIIGTEIQSYVDYSMPVRIMDYDALEYNEQIKTIKSKTTGVTLSPLSENDLLTPVVTLVLYIGDKPWNGADSLHNLLDFSEVPQEFQKYISDYKIHVLDVCHTPDERLLEFPKDIASMFLAIKYRENLPALKNVLKNISGDNHIEEDTYDAIWNFLDNRMLKLKEKSRSEGGINMCGAVDQMIEEGMERKETSLILKMLKNGLSLQQISSITDKNMDEIQMIAKNASKI